MTRKTGVEVWATSRRVATRLKETALTLVRSSQRCLRPLLGFLRTTRPGPFAHSMGCWSRTSSLTCSPKKDRLLLWCLAFLALATSSERPDTCSTT